MTTSQLQRLILLVSEVVSAHCMHPHSTLFRHVCEIHDSQSHLISTKSHSRIPSQQKAGSSCTDIYDRKLWIHHEGKLKGPNIKACLFWCSRILKQLQAVNAPLTVCCKCRILSVVLCFGGNDVVLSRHTGICPTTGWWWSLPISSSYWGICSNCELCLHKYLRKISEVLLSIIASPWIFKWLYLLMLSGSSIIKYNTQQASLDFERTLIKFMQGAHSSKYDLLQEQ